MLARSIKFELISEENGNESFNYDKSPVLVSEKDTLLLDLINNKVSDELLIESNGNKKIPFDDVCHILVNVKDVGGFHFYFASASFDKAPLLQEIINLSSIKDPKEKVSSLYELLKPHDILFIIYKQKSISPLKLEDLKFEEQLFFIEQKEEEKKIEEEKVPEKEQPKKEVIIKRSDNKFIAFWQDILAIIIKDKMHLSFAAIAAVIVTLTISVGLYNSFINNKIYIFFYIFAGIGTIFNYIVHKDFFKEGRGKPKNIAVSACASFIGFGLAIVFFILFYKFTKEKPETIPSSGKIILITLGIFVALELVSIIAGKFIQINFKKKSKK